MPVQSACHACGRACRPAGRTSISGDAVPGAPQDAEEIPIAILDADLRDLLAFDERLGALADLIGSIDRPGDYCAHSRLFAPMPRIEEADAGILSFPVPPAQLRALIAASERAPHGRGHETVVGRSVRDCLQIARDRIDVGGRTWAETLGGILDRAAEGLGCPGDAVATEFYKLLVYEPGGFFAPHRDTEKADGMVATLVIALPAAGAGGALAIRHGGRETVVGMRTDEPSELCWAAFYADCEHETLPVTEGHRVCLVYNLVLRPGGFVPAEAPDYGTQIAPIAAQIEARCRDPGESGKLVWLLEHDYSAAGLSFDALKSVDAAIARILAIAAERAECVLHAAILHVEETCSAEYRSYAPEVEDIRRPDLVPPDRTLPVLLEALLSAEGAKAGTGFAFAALWRHAADCLLSRSESPPRPPADRAIPADGLSCDCEHCAELRRFCAHPDAEMHRIPVCKALRAHLRRQIEYAGVDIRCETERRGSPHTLVCVKTRATYERRLRQYREDVVEMRRLAAAADAVPDPGGRAEALLGAVAKSR